MFMMEQPVDPTFNQESNLTPVMEQTDIIWPLLMH